MAMNRYPGPGLRHIIAIILLASTVLLAAPPRSKPVPVSPPDAAYHQSFEEWESQLVDDLKQEWLPLAGLFWLKPGENSFGTDPRSSIVFPKGPAHAGSFILQDKKVTVKFDPAAHATIAGKPAATAELQPDTSGNPTVVELGSLRLHVIVRGERIGIRVKDLESDAVRKYPGPVFFPLDLAYRVTATWLPSDGKQTVEVPNVLGDVTPTPVAGIAVFTINGQELRLTDMGGHASTGLFFVFADATSKTDTYPGGRFLKTDPVSNGTVVLDFNRAYSPPCAVTPYATCPLAPRENRLSVAITAGQKYDHKAGHH
jgi:uncharacterized protein (DUF1684 family)